VVVLSFDHQPHLVMVPLWLTGAIIGRDIMLLVGLVVIHLTVGEVKVRPHLVGKTATVMQMLVVLWVLLKWREDWVAWIFLAAALSTGFSGLIYVWDGVRQLSAHPASSPSRPPAEK
jgi:phosphatidylglycerophosphate synthase